MAAQGYHMGKPEAATQTQIERVSARPAPPWFGRRGKKKSPIPQCL